jgi:hypothetical protein
MDAAGARPREGTEPPEAAMFADPKDQLQAQGTYIDGKMKRYNLLFAVNGGAFALAQLLNGGQAGALGGLTVRHIAMGAILFTVVMAVDIALFALMMKRRYLGELAFNRPGQVILALLALLNLAGWSMVDPRLLAAPAAVLAAAGFAFVLTSQRAAAHEPARAAG